MHALKSARWAALLLFAGAIAGCAARSKMAVVHPLEEDLHAFSDVRVWVESRVTDDVRKETSDLEGLVVSKIKALNAFKSVQLQSGPAAKSAAKPSARTLLVKVVIAHVKKVGGTKRFMLGVGAGRASMTTEITFVQARTGKELGSYSVTGESGGSAFSGGTSDAVQKTAEGIADVISKSFAGRGSGGSQPAGK